MPAMSWTHKASDIMYLGIDLGTSAVKIVLVDDAQRVVASRSRSLTVSSPHPGHCEQDPAQWIEVTFATLDALKADHTRELAEVEGIGLSGQMHGATLLDAGHTPLRPCILWNDGRSFAECAGWSGAGPPCGRRQATRRCRDSPRQNCCGSPGTNRRSSRRQNSCCNPRPICAWC